MVLTTSERVGCLAFGALGKRHARDAWSVALGKGSFCRVSLCSVPVRRKLKSDG